jgi:hypothetical protein
MKSNHLTFSSSRRGGTSPQCLTFRAARLNTALGGMANASAFQREVLSRVAEDYEAPHTITSDIARLSEGQSRRRKLGRRC